MSKSAAAMLVLLFMTASCLMAKPALSSAAIVEDSWVSKAPMRQARSGLGVAVVNGKIYAIGGCTVSGFMPSISGSVVLGYGDLEDLGAFLGKNEEYDPDTDTWTTRAAMPTPRILFATAVYQNKIYCIGGKTSSGLTGVNEVYEPATDTWETKTPMPIVAGFSTVIDNKIYVVGSKLQIYDPEIDKWSQGTLLPSGSSGIVGAGVTTGVSAPRRIYAIGPLYPDKTSNCVYDHESDNWTFGADFPSRRFNFGVAIVNDMLYAIGGHTYDTGRNGYVETVAVNEQYTPMGYGTVPPTISVVSPENKRTYTETHISLSFAVNKLVVWLGYSLDGQETVTVTGNTTLSGLSSGLHNVTVYAKDDFENMGTSATVTFTVAEEPEPFPTTLIVAASGVSVAIIGIGLLVYFRRRNR